MEGVSATVIMHGLYECYCHYFMECVGVLLSHFHGVCGSDYSHVFTECVGVILS